MLLKMAVALKNIETRKTASITTTIAVAVLVAAFPTMTTVAFSQTSANEFQEFMECLFGDVGGSAATAQDIQNVLQGDSDDVTEQEIRDCFSPIYNDGTGSEDNTSSSNNNNDDDENDSTDETDNTDETDATEGDDTTEGSDETDTGGSDDTTTMNPDSTDSTDNTQ